MDNSDSESLSRPAYKDGVRLTMIQLVSLEGFKSKVKFKPEQMKCIKQIKRPLFFFLGVDLICFRLICLLVIMFSLRVRSFSTSCKEFFHLM